MSNQSEDVGRIVEGLTWAQRVAMRGDYDHAAGKIAPITTPGCRCALQRLGLVVDRQYDETLTPLGLKVRAALQRGKQG